MVRADFEAKQVNLKKKFNYNINHKFLRYWINKNLWIVKPCNLSGGNGIYAIDNIFNIDVDEMLKEVNQSIVQDPIANPLIINGHKFEMGLYVLMPSIDPLMSYIYKDGLARFATESHNTNSLDITSTFYILRMQK